MATFDAGLAAGYILRLTITQDAQSYPGNYTTAGWQLKIIKGTGSGRWADGPHNWSVNIGGVGGSGSIPSYDFRNYTELVLGSGQVNLGHNSTGYLTAYFAASFDDGNTWGQLGDGFTEGHVSFARIPIPPDPPTSLGFDQVTSSSFRYLFYANADGGSTVLEWQAQIATDPGFTTGVRTISSGSPAAFTALDPGFTYYARSRGRNVQGWGAWSNVLSVVVGLPAPTLTGWVQNSAGELVATWTPPAATNGLIGYRLQIARDAGFTTTVQNLDLGDVLTHAVGGLAGGRVYYARVAARTAGGVNAYSAGRSTMLVLDAGNLDGWSRVGAKPEQISYYTAEGLRRGMVGITQALWLESISTAAVTLPADTFGIQRTVTGLTIGNAYRFEASGTTAEAPLASQYRLNVVSEDNADPVTIATNTSLGYVEFVADAASVTLQILLAEPVVVPAGSDAVERVAFHGIRLLELNTDYPQRLRETVLESDLATHFDLACNSVGASWAVGKDGITRFMLPGTSLPVSAIFSDQPAAGAHSYIDIAAGHDTKALTNRLVVTNYGVDEDRDQEQNDELVVLSPASIADYGTRSQTLRTNLHSAPPYEDALNDRLAEILAARDQPELLISQVRLNAQQDLALAFALDVGQRVLIGFNGATQDSQIIAIRHDLQPTRWTVTLDVQPL